MIAVFADGPFIGAGAGPRRGFSLQSGAVCYGWAGSLGYSKGIAGCRAGLSRGTSAKDSGSVLFGWVFFCRNCCPGTRVVICS